MHIIELLTPDRVACNVQVSSKKRCLELLGELATAGASDITPGHVFDKLIERERLGSTGLGHGVAIPHCRVAGEGQALGAFVKLDTPIDFDAVDGQPVDLLFALVVPESAPQEHLQLLAQVAELFSDTDLCARLRAARDGDELYALLLDQQHRQRVTA